MPNIRQFDAPQGLGITPSDRAAESSAAAGRSIGRSYDDAASATRSVGNGLSSGIQAVGEQAVKWMDNREISAGGPAMATTLSKLDQKWNEIAKTSDPNDPTVAAKFREEVMEPELEKIKGAFNTERSQAWAEARIDSMRNHFVTKTSADMATLASVAAKQNIVVMTNQLSNAAISDPTSLKTSIDMANHSIDAMVDSSPNLRGADSAKIKAELKQDAVSQIVKSAAIGAIAQNPEAGLKKFSGSEYSKYISGVELRQLEQQAKTVQRAERVDENYRRKNTELAKEDASLAREGQYTAKFYSDDPKERASVSAREIANDFTLTQPARVRMLAMAERVNDPEPASAVSSRAANDLITRARMPEGDPRRIKDLNPVYDALSEGKLTKSDFKFVRDEVLNMRTPEGDALGKSQKSFIDSVSSSITSANPMLGKLDPSGDQLLYKFTYDLQSKISEYKRAGKDPYSLMNPSSPDYMGKPEALAPYQKTLQQSSRDIVNKFKPVNGPSGFPAQETITGTKVENLPPVEPRKAGESADAYLKRLGYK